MNSELLLIGLFISFAIGAIIWMIYNKNAESRQAKKIKSIYESKKNEDPKNPVKIKPINPNDKSSQYKVLDYYISSSYNSCCSGDFLNDYVSMDVLKTVIAQGARVLDLEIYMIDNNPVVAVSPFKSGVIKGSYNSLPLLGTNGVLDIINSHAFSLRTCPNYKDPLFINFRIKCDKLDYNAMHSYIIKIFKNKLLGPDYSYGGRAKYKIPSTPLNQLMGKVIIMCDQKSLAYNDTKFRELVNLSAASNSVDFRSMRASALQNQRETDYEGLEEENKNMITMMIPDLIVNNENIDFNAFKRHGVQMISMNYQNIDSRMDSAYNYFNKEQGQAFVLKPKRLRNIPIIVPDGDKQKPELMSKAKCKILATGQKICT